MLKSAVRISLVISGLAILLASCQTTITTTTTRPSTFKVVSEFENDSLFRDDDISIVRIDSRNVHLLRYGDSYDNSRIRGQLVLRSDHQKITTNRYGKIYEGKADLGEGLIDDIYTYEDDDYPGLYADLVYVDGGDEFLEVGGERHVTIPRGRITYSGTNIFGVVGYRNRNWGEYVTDGEFEMTVDFDAGSGSISGSTPTIATGNTRILDASEIDGNFGVNTETGTFSGTRLTVENLETNRAYEAEIYGSFHGSGAGGVTGLYVHDSNSPDFFGAIVGVAESD